MGSEEGDNVASVLACFGEVHSEIKRDAMLHTLHLSNTKGETSRALSKDRASLLKKALITSGMRVLGVLFMAVGEALTQCKHTVQVQLAWNLAPHVYSTNPRWVSAPLVILYAASIPPSPVFIYNRIYL